MIKSCNNDGLRWLLSRAWPLVPRGQAQMSVSRFFTPACVSVVPFVGTGGEVFIASGRSNFFKSGNINIASTSGGSSGNIALKTGIAEAGDSGGITFKTGPSLENDVNFSGGNYEKRIKTDDNCSSGFCRRTPPGGVI